jgi:hypothetical protein
MLRADCWLLFANCHLLQIESRGFYDSLGDHHVSPLSSELGDAAVAVSSAEQAHGRTAAERQPIAIPGRKNSGQL